MEKTVRKLARENNYQFLYKLMLSSGTIKFFKNNTELSDIQLYFLKWLDIYKDVFENEGVKSKCPAVLNKDVIADDIRLDAYLLWRLKNKHLTPEEQAKKTKVLDPTGMGVIFTK